MEKSDHFNITFRILRRNGSWRWIHDVGRVISRDPKTNKALRMVGMTRDSHQEKKRSRTFETLRYCA